MLENSVWVDELRVFVNAYVGEVFRSFVSLGSALKMPLSKIK